MIGLGAAELSLLFSATHELHLHSISPINFSKLFQIIKANTSMGMPLAHKVWGR
jgi:hypothetical protein